MLNLRILSESEKEIIKEVAILQFMNDARSDPRYAAETVQFLAESPGPQPMEWWIETISTDPDMVPELLGFDPYEEEA